MSLATRCPACGTTFRIEPEQLALADGWARCGRCSAVFDAAAEQRPELADDATSAATTPASTNAMTTLDEAPGSSPALALPAANAADAFGAALASFSVDLPPPSTSRSRADEALEPSDDGAEADAVSPGPSTPTDALSPAVPPMTPAFDPWRELPSLGLGPDAAAPAPAPAPAPVSMLDGPLPSSVAVEAPGGDESAAQPSEPTAEPSMPSETPAATAAPLWTLPSSGSTGPASGPSGVRPAARAEAVAPAGVIHAASEPVNDDGAGTRTPRGAGRRRSWRLAMLLLAIVLLLALLAQVLYRQRDAVAARHPALRPVMARLCGMAGCTIAAPRRPGDIAIEGASFTHVHDGDRYRLVFTLRNQADVPLAMPAIELSLLDAQERPVVRRVLRPAEFGAVETTLPPLAERAGTMSFALDEAAGTSAEPLPRIAGYAMVAFYP